MFLVRSKLVRCSGVFNIVSDEVARSNEQSSEGSTGRTSKQSKHAVEAKTAADRVQVSKLFGDIGSRMRLSSAKYASFILLS